MSSTNEKKNISSSYPTFSVIVKHISTRETSISEQLSSFFFFFFQMGKGQKGKTHHQSHGFEVLEYFLQ